MGVESIRKSEYTFFRSAQYLPAGRRNVDDKDRKE